MKNHKFRTNNKNVISFVGCVAAAIILLVIIVSRSVTLAATESNQINTTNVFEKRALPFLFKKNNSFLVSPYSFKSAMSLVQAGAKGKTLAELQQLNEGAQLFPNVSNDQTQITSVQKVWVESSYPLKAEYVDKVKTQWDSEVLGMAFKQNPNEQREVINHWVADQTNQKIKDLIPAGAINKDTKVVLANAIYFLSQWQQAFDPKQTSKQMFKPIGSKQVEKSFMVKKFDSIKYLKKEKWSAISLPYVQPEAELLVVLPKFGQKIQDIALEALTIDIADMSTTPVLVYFPKFTLQYQIDFAKFAKQLKITNSCSTKADFSEMSEQAKADKLFVSNIFHKTFMEVDEKGTEAAAATAVAMRVGSMGGEPIIFKADHPFLFVLKYKNQNLFLGYYNN